MIHSWILRIPEDGSKKENGARDAEDLSAAASHVQPRRFLQDPMLHVAGDHEICDELFNVEVVDEAAAAADGLHSRVIFILSSDDDFSAAFYAALHGSCASRRMRRRFNASWMASSRLLKIPAFTRRSIFSRSCLGSLSVHSVMK